MKDNRRIGVFISSTFRDVHAERDHLVRFMFPKLRQELLQRRIHLVDVDLRWGVTSEQDALSVCREVVDECRGLGTCLSRSLADASGENGADKTGARPCRNLKLTDDGGGRWGSSFSAGNQVTQWGGMAPPVNSTGQLNSTCRG